MPGTDPEAFFRPVVTVRLILHTTLLVVECHTTHATPGPSAAFETPEHLGSVLGKAFFCWTNTFLFQKFDSILVLRSLPALSQEIHPETTRAIVVQAWACRAGEPHNRVTLPLILLKCIMKPFLVAVIPRLFLTAFKYSQPRLIRESILFVGHDENSPDSYHGYWLVVWAIAIYSSIAISGALYQHQLNKLKLMLRSMLVALIHDKALELPSIAYDNGEANALMSNDVDHLRTMIDIVHETWAYLLEVVVGIFLLAKQVGWIWPLPLVLVFVFSRLGIYVTRNLLMDQKNWNQATQARIAATSSMVSSMKGIKMLGLQSVLSSQIKDLRKHELYLAAKVRWVMVYYNACTNSLGIFSPALTLVTFALLAQARGVPMDTATAFTAIATLNMIMHPTNMIMTAWPRVIAALASFERIKTFLLKQPLEDYRESNCKSPRISLEEGVNSKLVRYPQMLTPAIVVHDLATEILRKPTNLTLARGTFTMVSGPIGSGKSTLLRCLLGEAPPDRGSVILHTHRIAYCAQSPWLPEGTIREIIQGPLGSEDDQFYGQVIDACLLKHDINAFPKGDDTWIGNRGLNLAGGLTQRVALARAIFARYPIALLDDTFSALDGDTERTVFYNLLGPAGLLRRMGVTVVLATNSSQYFPMADHIVILGDSGVVEQGAWQTLSTEASAIHKFEPQKRPSEPAETSAVQSPKECGFETERYRRSGNITLYGYYFKFAGFSNLALLVGWTAAYAFFVSVPQLWLRLWTESEDNTWYYITGFLLICIFALASTHGTIWTTVIRLAPYSGIQVHKRLLDIIMKYGAPLSYFSAVENGSILNRFIQDIQYIDQELPMTLADVSNQIFKLCTQAVLLYTAEKLLALSLPVSFLAVYLTQKLCMGSSRQLQLLELESRAAIFSDFLKSIEGLATIRAFGWQQAVTRESVRNLHASQCAEFLRLSLQRWLGLVLDLIGAAMAAMVIATVTTYRSRISPGQAGIALNVMLVANATLLGLVNGWTTLELNLGAMARVRSLEDTITSESKADAGENNDLLSKPWESWPSRGALKITEATANYQCVKPYPL
ncbi:putative ABC transporter [Hypoxylon cercidicola]|nr:putative ABC transporter [Hypoxylon cercidicola]